MKRLASRIYFSEDIIFKLGFCCFYWHLLNSESSELFNVSERFNYHVSLKVLKAVPVRFNIGVMIFFACWVNYMTRVNMSIIIIAMVFQNSSITSVKSECDALKNNTNYVYNEMSDISENEEWRQGKSNTFNWTAQEQAYVLSGYFWGQVLTSFIGGMAVEVVRPRLLVFYITLLSGVLNMLSPQAARIHYMVLVVVRFILGCAAGIMFPALHDLLVRWAPPDEKGKFMSTLLGGAIGTVFTWSLIGPLIENFGWEYAFYISGALVVVWCLFWWYLVYDSPLLHPRISNTEKEYILQAIGDKVQHSLTKRPTPPYKSIFTSFPFLAMIILQYGNGWGFHFVLTAAPKYVSTALGFNLTSAGLLSSLPYLARMTFSLIFGVIGDRIVRTKRVSTTFIRKFFCLFSHIIPGILLIALGYTGCTPFLSIGLITFTLGFNGAATLTNLVNHHDLAPNFAATLYGIAYGISNTAGFIAPLVTAHFTKNGNGFAEWRPVFITGASLYIFSAMYFIIFGTAETQSWNSITTEKKQTEKEKETRGYK